MHKIKHILSGPESALLLRDLYDKEYNAKYYDGAAEHAFSCVLYRETESTENFTSLSMVLSEYTELDILKFFGMPIKDYLELTRYERFILNTHALKLIEKLNTEAAAIQNSVDNVKQSFNEFQG